MLDISIESVGREIDRAVEFRRKHTVKLKEIIRRYTGRWYRDDHTCAPTPENHWFAYTSFMVSNLAYSAPKCRVTAEWNIQHRDIARAMEIALNRWAKTFPLESESQTWVRDAMFGWGVLKIGIEPNVASRPVIGGYSPSVEFAQSEYSVSPFMTCIPAWEFAIDPRCGHWKHARFMSHEYWRDRDDIPFMRGVDQMVADKLTSEYRTLGEESRERVFKDAETAARDQVLCVDVWFPEHRKIATVVRGSGGWQYLRQPSEWWGPSSGPFNVLGFYGVPDDPYPIGPFQPIMDQIQEMQAHVAAAANEASQSKTLVLVDASDTEIKDRIANAQTGSVLAVKNLANHVQVVTMGGIAAGRMEHIEDLRTRVDRMLGWSDAQRGVGGNSKTATESQIVQQNSDQKTNWMSQCLLKQMTDALRAVGWYMFYDENYVSRISQLDPITGGTIEGFFLGGVWPGQEGVDWERDFAITIEPNSMQRTDDQVVQGRALQLVTVVPQVRQAMAMFPDVNWRYLIDMLGQSFNQPDLFDLVFMGVVPGAPLPMQASEGLKSMAGGGGINPQAGMGSMAGVPEPNKMGGFGATRMPMTTASGLPGNDMAAAMGMQ